jgi:hypothetical protein
VFLVPFTSVGDVCGPIPEYFIASVIFHGILLLEHALRHPGLRVDLASQHVPSRDVAALVQRQQLLLELPKTQVLATWTHTDETQGCTVQQRHDSYAVV